MSSSSLLAIAVTLGLSFSGQIDAARASPQGQTAEIDSAVMGSYGGFVSTALQWKLPNRLSEISGLATTVDDRLFAHNDERAVIYEIDARRGKLIKGFAFADPPVRGDFEGLAIVDDRFFLVTSDGRLYEGREGNDGERLTHTVYVTALGTRCEVEGLSFDAAQNDLLLLCKTARADDLRSHVSIYRWSVMDRRLDDRPILFPLEAFTRALGGKEFRASGLERVPGTDHFMLVAALQHAIAEVTLDGRVWTVYELPQRRHRQTEGIAFLSDGTLILSDEGAGRRARLTLYENRAATWR